MSWDAATLLLGVLVVVGLALLVSPLADQTDQAMIWEGRVAVGFAAVGFVGPFWLGQGIAAVIGTLSDGGIWPGWLWAWFIGAPLLGVSPTAGALARAAQRAVRPRGPGTDPRTVAAVGQEANFAWAATEAEPEWLLRRTPPLPECWPPRDGGSAVWLCYAERPGTAGMVEVTAPWARITLAPGASGWPVVDRLADAVESIGLQRAQTGVAGERRPQSPLLDWVYGGDPKGKLAKALSDWRIRNGLIASHPDVASHLPPG